MRHTLLATYILTLLCLVANKAQGQDFAVKTNALYDTSLNLNLGLEVALGDKTTLELPATYNPWTWKDDRKLRFILVQPELRHWFCQKFEGHFIGLHAHGADWYGCFNGKRRDGWLAGGGISYGYAKILSPHWNMETEIGIGYARLWWKEGDHIPCIKYTADKSRNYWGVTRLSIAFEYIF